MNDRQSEASAEAAGNRPVPAPSMITMISESFGISRAVILAGLVLIGLGLVAAVGFFLHSAPPSTITISSGPEGSIFYTNAGKYAGFLKRQGVTLKILTSNGSLDNLQRLETGSVDLGFVQGGITNGITDKLMSLGSISYQPLLVFYRGTNVETLAGLAGRQLAIGPVGSGTRTLVLTLLAANGIKAGEATTLQDWDAPTSAQALMAGTVDAVFLMGEDASPAIMRQLLLAPDVHLLNFSQAEAYTRKFSYLSVLKLPQGGIDFGRNIPAHDVNLIGPTVELIARDSLHPALSDLLLQAAQEVHGKASLLQHKREFPAPIEHDFRISEDAARFYKSGTGFFYRYLPFWMASLTSRILVVFVPAIVILIPILRSLPHLYRWRNQTRIYRWYRALLVLERELFNEPDAGKRQRLLKRLDAIQTEVGKMKVPAFLADQFYGLRGHIDVVRQMANDKIPK
jgi:TRAP transporter TAXI family solute receptor